MDIEFLRKNYRAQILEIAEICNVENVRIFGSRVRGDAREDSDIDFSTFKAKCWFRIMRCAMEIGKIIEHEG